MPLDDRGLYAPADFSQNRSQAFAAPQLAPSLRAQRARLREPKRDKHGRPYLGRNHALLGHGFHDVQEAERLLLDAAAEVGLAHDAVEIEAAPWLETEINSGLGPT